MQAVIYQVYPLGRSRVTRYLCTYMYQRMMTTHFCYLR